MRTRSLSCKQLLYKTHSRVERHLSACNRSTKPSTRETCSLAACPTVAPRRPSRHIVIDRSTYVQLKPQKKVQVLVGGRGVFFPGTVVSVRCTVKRFPRRNVRWRHNGKYVRSKGRIKARNGVLHIRRSRAKDAGLYTCVASNLTADIAIGFQSYDEATEKFRLRVEYIAKNSLFMQRLRERRARHRIKSWKVFTLPYLLDKIGLASIPLGYFAGNWSACSKTCGGAGLMYRDIQCELVQDAYYLQVDDEYCLEKGLTPPIESRDCGYQECPHWEVGPWSEVRGISVSYLFLESGIFVSYLFYGTCSYRGLSHITVAQFPWNANYGQLKELSIRQRDDKSKMCWPEITLYFMLHIPSPSCVIYQLIICLLFHLPSVD